MPENCDVIHTTFQLIYFMIKITYTLVYNRKKRLRADRKALVQVEAYLQGKRKYFSTNIYLNPEQWDNRRKLIRKHSNADELKKRIQEFIYHIENLELKIWQREKRISLDLLKDAVCNRLEENLFVDFFMRETMQAGIKPSTRHNHLSTLKKLKEFNENIKFEDINYRFLLDFENFLYRSGCQTNTIAKHMRHLKRYINLAIKQGYGSFEPNLFMKYRIKLKDVSHSFLLPEELVCFESINLHPKLMKLQQILDAFLFCCYTGLRYSDFCNLKKEAFAYNSEGVWLTFRTIKTDTEIRLPLHLLFEGKAMAIVERYKADLNSFFHLPDNSNVNKQLNKLRSMAGVKKKITFHVARHTNATLLIYYGVSITTVQKLLGHKNVRTTEVYARILDKTVINDLQNSVYK